MLGASEWARVRTLAADGLSQRAIACRLGINRRTVAGMLASEAPPRYRRAPIGSQVDPFVPLLRRLPEGRIQENGVEKDLFWNIDVFEEARVRPLLLKKPVDVFRGFSREAPVRGTSKQLE